MKTLIKIAVLSLIVVTLIACKKETREKLKQAKQNISNTTTIVKEAS